MVSEERLLPESYRASVIWKAYYDGVTNQGRGEKAKSGLERVRREYNLTPEIEQSLREEKYGVRLKGIFLMALQRAGEEVSKEERKYIRDNFDLIKGGLPFQS